MNLDNMVFHWKQAVEQLNELMQEMTDGELTGDNEDEALDDAIGPLLQHAYQHLNMGWNQRFHTQEQLEAEDWEREWKFPDDIDLWPHE